MTGTRPPDISKTAPPCPREGGARCFWNFVTPQNRLVWASRKLGRICSVVASNREFVCHGQCGSLICLQGDLLCEHDVASDQSPIRNKAEADNRLAIFSQFLDVCSGTVSNAIALPAIAADNNTEVAVLRDEYDDLSRKLGSQFRIRKAPGATVAVGSRI